MRAVICVQFASWGLKILGPPPVCPGFPQVGRRIASFSNVLGPTRGVLLKLVHKLAEAALPVALAGSFSPDLGRDHRNDADDLRLRGKPVWIEAISRPRQVVVHAVEAKAEQMLDLLRGTPSVPAGRVVCSP